MDITDLMNVNIPKEIFSSILNSLITVIIGKYNEKAIDIIFKKHRADAII